MEEEEKLNIEDALACDGSRVRMPSAVRMTSAEVCELAYERKDVARNLELLKKAIAADPEAVSAHHKELWRKQAKAMQEYIDVLGERIKDLIDNG